jgi:hypothetical protein
MIVKHRRAALRRMWAGIGPIFRPVLAAGIIIGISAGDSHAYLDGGAGSYLIQIVLAGVFTLTFFFGRIRERLGKAWQVLMSREKSDRDKEGRLD